MRHASASRRCQAHAWAWMTVKSWGHLARTVLPEYVSNTFWLMLWVGAGVAVIGIATAWLTTMCRFGS